MKTLIILNAVAASSSTSQKLTWDEALLAGFILGLIIAAIVGIIWLIVWYVKKSIFLPESSKYYAVELFKNFHHIIGGSNEGISINDPRRKRKFKKFTDAWELLSDPTGKYDGRTYLQKKYNWYFIWYGIYRIKKYDITYEKAVDKTRMDEGDAIIWDSDPGKPKEGTAIVRRKRETNYVPWRASHARVTVHATTGHGISDEALKKFEEKNVLVPQIIGVNTRTNNIVESVNPYKMIYKIDDYVKAFFGSFDARMRAFTGGTSILDFNKIDSEESQVTGISKFMKYINEASEPDNTDGVVVNIGAKLHITNFMGYEGTTEEDKKVIGSINEVFVAYQKAEAAGIEGAGEGARAENQLKGKAKGEQALLEAQGWITVKDGKTTQRNPDPNVKEIATALKEAKNHTLVLDTTKLVPTLNVNN